MQENIVYKNHLSRTEKYRLELFLLFLFWPLLAFILALRYYHLREAKIIVYLFFVFFGATFYLGNPTFDSFGLFQEFQLIANRPFGEFWTILSGLYTETRADMAQPFILFSVSRLGNNQFLIFGALAAVFGWFYLRGINMVFSPSVKQNVNAFIFFLYFLSIVPIFRINGFRFWTAAWVFFYGAYNVVQSRDMRFFIFSLLSILFHFSFIFPNVILIAWFLLGNRNKAYTMLLVISILIPELFWPQIQSVAAFFGGTIEAKFNVYTNPEYGEKILAMRQSLRWFMNMAGWGIFYYTLFMLFYLKSRYEKILENIRLNNLFSFSLLFLSAVNFTRYIPSMGRFMTIFYLFAFSYFIAILAHFKDNKLRLSTWLGLVPMMLSMIITIRAGMEMTSLWLLAPLPLAIYAEPVSVYEFLTQLF